MANILDAMPSLYSRVAFDLRNKENVPLTYSNIPVGGLPGLPHPFTNKCSPNVPFASCSQLLQLPRVDLHIA